MMTTFSDHPRCRGHSHQNVPEPEASPDGVPSLNRLEVDGVVHALVRRIRQREPEAMDTLIDLYGIRLRQTIGRLLAWSTDVDDVLQDVLLRAWQRFDTFREEGTLEDWLVSLAFHRCRDYQRSMRRRLDHWFRYADQFSRHPLLNSPVEQIESVLETPAWQQIQHAMQQLAASDRELLVMIYLEHWSHQQLANHLRISVDVLHGRLHRARNRLKKQIQIT